ncbi:hypothetical protein ACPPVT_14390 [Angustibacter sp. McL0619]|uniref:hypothetical protein n=1 Tax=Angustibacter sp. McL0619 TaxID=3415676 RepID=UPI003CE88264
MSPPTESRGLFAQASVAAYSTLRPHGRARFDAMLGADAGPAAAVRFLASAVHSDRWAERIIPWWNAHADYLTEALIFLTGVSTEDSRALLTAVLYLDAGQDDDLATHAVLRHAERAAAFMAGERLASARSLEGA